MVRLLHRTLALFALAPLCAHSQTAPVRPRTIILRSSQPIQAEDLHLTVANQPQTILRLEPQPANTHVPEPLNLPPGTFTDIAPVAPDGTLNILLIDALNTPSKSPNYLRTQLQQLTEHATPATPLAIFGLADHVILLQGFSSPQPLKDAVEHKLIPRAATDHANDGASPSEALLAANLQQFIAQAASVDTQLRSQRTLDALNTLAHYFASLPGRKNLLWLSASFPDGLLSDAAKPSGLNADELYETRALLNSAHVAIFPIDARKLLPASATKDIAEPAQHAIMTQIAEATGGEPLFDAADLPATVVAAIRAGSSAYTLTFTPITPPGAKTSQPIQITATNANTKLAYPRQLYAAPGKPSDAYLQSAIARGAPAPADILFKVRVLPESTSPEPKVAPTNTENPSYKVPGPWQRYAIDYIALGNQFVLPLQPDGKHSGKVEFFSYVYDMNGRLLNTEGKGVSINLTADQYEKFQTAPISMHLEVSVPLRQESFLRIAIHDTSSDRVGVVELPASSVSQLPPAPTPNH